MIEEIIAGLQMQISTHHPPSCVDACPVVPRVEQHSVGTDQRKNTEMGTENKMAGVHAT